MILFAVIYITSLIANAFLMYDDRDYSDIEKAFIIVSGPAYLFIMFVGFVTLTLKKLFEW